MKEKIAIFLIVVVAFLVRLWRIDTPLADWHSWRQADTGAVSRNFVKNGIDLLHPRFDDLSNVASGMDNPEGWRFVEFPAYNALQALTFTAFGSFSLEVWGRLVSIFFSLGSLVFIYLLARKYLGHLTALFSAFFFALLPYNIYYSRVILPEPATVFAGLGMLFCWDQFVTEKRLTHKVVLGLGGLLFGSLAFLLKPYVGVYLLPLAATAIKTYGLKLRNYLLLGILILLTLVPFYLWRSWMSQYPEGIPAFDWLFNENGIRFSPYFFYWIFAKRLGELILGFWGVSLLVLGLIYHKQKEGAFFYLFLAGILAYFWILAGGNVKHDYYQVISLPVIAVFLGKGAEFLLNASGRKINRFASRIILLTVVVFSLGFSWFQIKDYFNINNEAMVLAGKRADEVLPSDAKVIAPYGGDTAFLYQTNRQGWPVGIAIEEMVESGAQFYVNTNVTDAEVDFVKQKYCLIEETDQFVIVDLTEGCF